MENPISWILQKTPGIHSDWEYFIYCRNCNAHEMGAGDFEILKIPDRSSGKHRGPFGEHLAFTRVYQCRCGERIKEQELKIELERIKAQSRLN